MNTQEQPFSTYNKSRQTRKKQKLESARMAEVPEKTIPLEEISGDEEMILETEADLEKAKLASAKTEGEPGKSIKIEPGKPGQKFEITEDVGDILKERAQKVEATLKVADRMESFISDPNRTNREKIDQLKKFIETARGKLTGIDAKQYDEIRRNLQNSLEKAVSNLIMVEGRTLSNAGEKGLEYVVNKINASKHNMDKIKAGNQIKRELGHLDSMINYWQTEIEATKRETPDKIKKQNLIKRAQELRDAQLH